MACGLLLGACVRVRPAAPALEFVVVRHAEKRSDDSEDPELSDVGVRRAQRLAHSLSRRALVAVYATAYRRTRATAAPAAAAHARVITVYDAKQDADAFATVLKQRHASGTVLVVGHSNTVPAIAAALCGCRVAPIRDDEYGRRLVIRYEGNGTATLTDSRTR